MLKKIFQSPIFNVVLIIGLGLVMIGDHYAEHIPAWLVVDPMVLGVPILILMALIPIYNKRHPTSRIKPSVIPMEMREEDEGMQWLTFKATRKVYIFFAFAIPIGIALTAYLQHIPYLPVVLFSVMGAMQYLIYWFQMKSIT
ncbi:hypothetical protein [Rossellomorea aquimaris]|uniref:hypothetical protein n=1 Tax=Rossellomorea aquimaris TaxID=189382 RepID=UPI001CFE449F|nr:hypothetical protein [Rossellomorea aquimaris]